MNKKIIFSIVLTIFLISVFSLSLAQTVSAEKYFEIEDEWYEMPPAAQEKIMIY